MAADGRSAADARADAAHAHMMADRAIQHDMPAIVPPAIPDWLRLVAHAIRAAWPVLRIAIWAALALALVAILAAMARRLIGWRRLRRAADAPDVEDMTWRPAAASARALLTEADALAAAGRYGEAARLVLHRSIEDIARRCPTLVGPATTSRDLAAATALPVAARPAFAAIAGIVERSLFADRGADGEAWDAARGAYARFARIDDWR